MTVPDESSRPGVVSLFELLCVVRVTGDFVLCDGPCDAT